MAYSNNYGFNLGIRTGVLRDLDRGQRPEKYKVCAIIDGHQYFYIYGDG